MIVLGLDSAWLVSPVKYPWTVPLIYLCKLVKLKGQFFETSTSILEEYMPDSEFYVMYQDLLILLHIYYFICRLLTVTIHLRMTQGILNILT